MNMIVNKRYLLKVIVNLYYVSNNPYPDYGGEIDELSNNGISSDEGLNSFYNLFLNYYNKHNNDFIDFINNFSILNDRSRFFIMCCKKEIELIKKNDALLIFYWDDFFLYQKNGFDAVVEKAIQKKEYLLKTKKQISIEKVKELVSLIIKNNYFLYKNLLKVILFGSLAKNTNNEFSDVDLLFVYTKEEPISKQLAYIFKKEFSKRTERLLDVSSIIDGDNNRFIDWVLSYGIEVYSYEK